jgi:hypothetical protein
LEEVPGGELNESIPPKPKPRYSKKIKNSGGSNASDGTSLLRIQNNIEV